MVPRRPFHELYRQPPAAMRAQAAKRGFAPPLQPAMSRLARDHGIAIAQPRSRIGDKSIVHFRRAVAKRGQRSLGQNRLKCGARASACTIVVELFLHRADRRREGGDHSNATAMRNSGVKHRLIRLEDRDRNGAGHRIDGGTKTPSMSREWPRHRGRLHSGPRRQNDLPSQAISLRPSHDRWKDCRRADCTISASGHRSANAARTGSIARTVACSRTIRGAGLAMIFWIFL